MKYLRTIPICSLSVVLAACGGGDSPPSPAMDAKAAPLAAAPSQNVDIETYMGTWAFCAGFPGAPFSTRVSFTFTKTSETTAKVLEGHAIYNTDACRGAPATKRTTQGTVLFIGAKRIGDDAAAKVDIRMDPPQAHALAAEDPSSPAAIKQIYVIKSDGNFYTGLGRNRPGAIFDFEGYPEVIDSSAPFVKE